jgi:hypothetical protein
VGRDRSSEDEQLRPLLRVSLIALILAALVPSSLKPALAADGSGCSGGGDLGDAHWKCVKSGAETVGYIAGHSDHTYSIRPACEIGGTALCAQPGTCQVDGHDGLLYNVYVDDSPEPLDWQACLTKQESRHLGGVTPGVVQRAFQRLSWPASELVVQPPQGRTLVNFDTNFYTTNDHPTTQTVTLIGQRVTIEATPTQYTWHFDSDAADGVRATTDPGAAYPHLHVTYRYLRVGTVNPSVDTTYAGRYRVGNGGWHQIPDTLTVPGPPVTLEVVSATPHLLATDAHVRR